MIVLGALILLMIAVAAGARVGVAVAKAKNNNNPSPTSALVTVTPSISSSPTPTPILKNTPLAAVNWNPSNTQIFYKHTDGSIRLQEDNGLECAGENSTLMESAAGIAVAIYGPDQDISTSNMIDPLSAESQLTAFTWFENGGRQIRVYYHGQDGYIREAAFDTRAGGGAIRPQYKTFPGQGINIDGKLRSYDYKPAATWVQSWQNSTVDYGSIPDGAPLTTILDTSSDMALRIYYIGDGKLWGIWWREQAGWNSSSMHDAAALGVAAVSYSNNIHVFFQNKTEYLSVLGFNRCANQLQFTAII
ncbi:hypothetical protein B9Z19DRAFT_1135124 [Tuber borchii]|uniref:Fucose-specific lectin n=1 Tax=Tuber borchii TaxID=42251 RepID=A0A2T6ZD75_TUBBO|nr:hypothetical protein B9Z19DRAFT_1135124 [Tuber borchii]